MHQRVDTERYIKESLKDSTARRECLLYAIGISYGNCELCDHLTTKKHQKGCQVFWGAIEAVRAHFLTRICSWCSGWKQELRKALPNLKKKKNSKR